MIVTETTDTHLEFFGSLSFVPPKILFATGRKISAYWFRINETNSTRDGERRERSEREREREIVITDKDLFFSLQHQSRVKEHVDKTRKNDPP